MYSKTLLYIGFILYYNYLTKLKCPENDIHTVELLLFFFFCWPNFDSFYSLYYRHIDQNQEKYIKRLADTVAIKSVSAWPESRSDILTMQEWVKTVSS